MNYWCESCARKNLCYVVDDRPKCFVPITNTASGTPYLVGISSISRDSHEIAKEEPQICDICRYYNSNIPCGSTPSACKEADKFAEEFVDGLKKLKPTISKMEQVDKPQTERSE